MESAQRLAACQRGRTKGTEWIPGDRRGRSGSIRVAGERRQETRRTSSRSDAEDSEQESEERPAPRIEQVGNRPAQSTEMMRGEG